MEKAIKRKKKNKVGRKPVADKKIQLCIYIEQSFVDNAGGEDEAKQIAIEAIKKSTNK